MKETENQDLHKPEGDNSYKEISLLEKILLILVLITSIPYIIYQTILGIMIVIVIFITGGWYCSICKKSKWSSELEKKQYIQLETGNPNKPFKKRPCCSKCFIEQETHFFTKEELKKARAAKHTQLKKNANENP